MGDVVVTAGEEEEVAVAAINYFEPDLCQLNIMYSLSLEFIRICAFSDSLISYVRTHFKTIVPIPGRKKQTTISTCRSKVCTFVLNFVSFYFIS